MVTRSTLDPVAEARARVRLRYLRARRAHPGAPAIGLIAERIGRKKGSGKLPAIQQLKTRWEDIVGAKLYRYCRPEKITGGRDGRTLTLTVMPAAATLIQHQLETIRERVSVAAGGDVARIKIVQGPMGTRASARSKTKPARRLTDEERADLKAASGGIEDTRLRAAIVALGAAVLTASPDEDSKPASPSYDDLPY
jgi:hypothetical protein